MKSKIQSSNSFTGKKIELLTPEKFQEIQFALDVILNNPNDSRPEKYNKIQNVFKEYLPSANTIRIEDCGRLAHYIQKLSGAFQSHVGLIRLSKNPALSTENELSTLTKGQPSYVLYGSKSEAKLYFIDAQGKATELKVKNMKALEPLFYATVDKPKEATETNLEEIKSQTGHLHQKRINQDQTGKSFKDKCFDFKHTLFSMVSGSEESTKKFEDPYKAACGLLFDMTVTAIKRDVENHIQSEGKKLYESDQFDNDLGAIRYNGMIDFIIHEPAYKDVLIDICDGKGMVLNEEAEVDLYDDIRRKTTTEEVEESLEKGKIVQDYESDLKDAYVNMGTDQNLKF